MKINQPILMKRLKDDFDIEEVLKYKLPADPGKCLDRN